MPSPFRRCREFHERRERRAGALFRWKQTLCPSCRVQHLVERPRCNFGTEELLDRLTTGLGQLAALVPAFAEVYKRIGESAGVTFRKYEAAPGRRDDPWNFATVGANNRHAAPERFDQNATELLSVLGSRP